MCTYMHAEYVLQCSLVCSTANSLCKSPLLQMVYVLVKYMQTT